MTSDVANNLPSGWYQCGPQAIAIAACAGTARREVLSRLLGEAAAGGARVWFLPCDFATGGPWAGVRDLFGSLVTSIPAVKAAVLRRHDYELVRVLPSLRSSLGSSREGLTETAPVVERVRNAPADRAFRLSHGLADLFFEVQAGEPASPAVLACDSFDQASAIATHFFTGLLRRSACRLPLTLLVAGAPGTAPALLARFAPGTTRHTVAPALTGGTDSDRETADPRAAAAQAEEFEERAAADSGAKESLLPSLIRLWLAAGRYDRALPWLVLGLETYNFMGIYSESAIYGEQALAIQKEICPDDQRLHLRIVAKLFYSYIALKRPKEALRFFLTEAPRERQPPLHRAKICYALAMVHARYLPQRDFARGEDLLAEGLRHLEEADATADDYHFEYVWNRNGLAMIRQFQGRPGEALELCREGYALLAEHLAPGAHRLHRSVLVYNMAQVQAAMGATEEAIAQYTAVIALDPNYSDYYNERGNAYLRLGRFAEALADYERASQLSPPYPEVLVNLGQCCRELGQMARATDAYSRALDLEPDLLLALLGRAQTYDATGQIDAAVADYSAALELDPGAWQARLNRGILHYGEGRLAACLADLDAAIALAPEVAQLYQNRSVALAHLGRHDEAMADLREYLRRETDAPDREATLARLAALAVLTKSA
jgi:tetratricopeptide (TPR) repeat protein